MSGIFFVYLATITPNQCTDFYFSFFVSHFLHAPFQKNRKRSIKRSLTFNTATMIA